MGCISLQQTLPPITPVTHIGSGKTGGVVGVDTVNSQTAWELPRPPLQHGDVSPRRDAPYRSTCQEPQEHWDATADDWALPACPLSQLGHNFVNLAIQQSLAALHGRGAALWANQKGQRSQRWRSGGNLEDVDVVFLIFVHTELFHSAGRSTARNGGGLVDDGKIVSIVYGSASNASTRRFRVFDGEALLANTIRSAIGIP
eukprot:gene9777-biopygen1610